MKTNTTLIIQWYKISLHTKSKDEYISLTDIAKHKDPEKTWLVISHWLSAKSTIDFLWTWEKLNNPNFNVTEFSNIRMQGWSNGYVLSSSNWIESTGAIGIHSSPWRYGWTYAHKDIAFEFASWISPEFKLYLITEFQRLKAEQQEKLSLGWDVKRELAKVNYKIHTDAIKEYLLPTLWAFQKKFAYADEADFLNVLVFWKTAKMWQDENPKLPWNMRDYASALDLVILSNIENFNALYISEWLSQEERYLKLREIILRQRTSLESTDFKRLEK